MLLMIIKRLVQESRAARRKIQAATEKFDERLIPVKIGWLNLKLLWPSTDYSPGHNLRKQCSGQKAIGTNFVNTSTVAENRTRWNDIIAKLTVMPK